MANMRKCKECGKLFQPKGREQYCSDVHYRPCPVCGTLVEVKYLSDPPRRCANCKGSKVPQMKPLFDLPKEEKIQSEQPKEEHKQELQENSQLNIELPTGKDIRRFIGRDYKHGRGYLPNHLYELNIAKDDYSYIVSAIYDWTEGKEANITELFSSKISIDGHFEKLTE